MSRGSTGSPWESSVEFLLSRIDYERTPRIPYLSRAFKLDRMRNLLAQLGNPHQGMPAVHVAGTKGKGSTAAMTAAMLTAAGIRTGLYSSPHLHALEERLRVDGLPCTEGELTELVGRIRPVVEALDRAAGQAGRGPTYFEIFTAMAFLHFARKNVQIAVLEVGLGGRLDSTNVCEPAVCIITSISFDHMEQLGDTLAAIAAEKAGIVKPGVPVASGVVEDEPRAVIEAVCVKRNSPLFRLGADFHVGYRPPRELDLAPSCGSIDFLMEAGGRRSMREGIPLALPGVHQAANAGLALAAVELLSHRGFHVPSKAAAEALSHLWWPARIEVVRRRPAVIVDAAHNGASVQALVETLEESFTCRRRRLLFGTTVGKDVDRMLETLLPRFERVAFTRYWNNPRSVDPGELADRARRLGRSDVLVADDQSRAWELVSHDVRPDELVCITGSFFLASEMRARFVAPLIPQTEPA